MSVTCPICLLDDERVVLLTLLPCQHDVCAECQVPYKICLLCGHVISQVIYPLPELEPIYYPINVGLTKKRVRLTISFI